MAATIFSLLAVARPAMGVLAVARRADVRRALSIAALLTYSPGASFNAGAAGRMGSPLASVPTCRPSMIWTGHFRARGNVSTLSIWKKALTFEIILNGNGGVTAAYWYGDLAPR